MKYKFIAIALFVFSVAIFISSYKVLIEYDQIKERFVPNLWVAAQAEIEMLRFLDALSTHVEVEEPEPDDLAKRLYIFWSRLPLLLHGSESTHVREIVGATDTIKLIDSTLRRLEHAILQLERGDSVTLRAIHAEFEAFKVPIHRIVSMTMLKDEEAAAAHRSDIRRIFWDILWCFVGIAVSATTLVVILFRALHQANAASAIANATKAQLKAVIDAIPAKISARDFAGRVMFRNRYDLAFAASGNTGGHLMAIDQLDRQVLESGVTIPLFEEVDATCLDPRSWLTTKVPVADADNKNILVVTVSLDITKQKEAQQRNALLAMAVEHAGDAIEITDSKGRFKYVNSAFEALSGYSREEAIGQTPLALLVGHDCEEPHYAAVQKVVESGQGWHGVLTARRRDGSVYQQETTISPVRDAAQKIIHFVAVKRDITDRLEAEAKILHLAHHDSLTGLVNRVRFQERLRESLAQARRDSSLLAVHFLDLDDFKGVNDSLGHAMGDKLLMAVTKRIRRSTRESDTIARLGGDEFAVIQPKLSSSDEAGEFAKRLLATLSEPYDVDGQILQTSISIGITLYPLDDENPEQLLKNADMAMYRAKSAGRANFQFFTQEMKDAFEWRKMLECDLRKAIAAGDQLELFYQPLVDGRSGSITAVEALLRWMHPNRGPIPPSEFIPVAEEGGLIVELGEWVLNTACAQNKHWQSEGLPLVRMAVNLSAVQFNHHNLHVAVHEALASSGLDPRYLELEITEGVLMKDAEAAVATLQQLTKFGIRIALDDFGTGYSSMGYLKRFPVHKIKIDRTFITEVVTDPGDAAIVEAVVRLAHGLGLTVTAEGVETSEQVDRLRLIGCTELQGYYFGRPMPAIEMEQKLRGQAAASSNSRRACHKQRKKTAVKIMGVLQEG